MVGGWCRRKGCDIIVEAISRTSYKLLHVGSIVDLPFPNTSHFVHVDSVNQDLLMFFYNLAKAFVLPSREEGLAMVQAQALACGLPLIGSKYSGAEDISKMLGTRYYISVVSDYSAEHLVHEMDKCMKHLNTDVNENVNANDMVVFSWQAYAGRYDDFIKKIYYGR